MATESIIDARWIIPVDDHSKVLEDHSVVISAGRIADILPRTEALTRYPSADRIELPGQALIPGLINAHTHIAMSLLRGVADDLPLMQWLNEHIWPIEGRWVSDDFVHDGTQLGVAEMLLGGTTCFNDMYFFPEITARAAATAGIRATVGLIVLDFPTVWAQDASEYIQKGLEIHDQFRHESLIKTAFAPHAPYSVSDAPLQRIRTLAHELNIPIHMHVHETGDEVEQAVKANGKRPLERLEALGLLSSNLLAVHMTQLNDEDIAAFAKSGGHIVTCPESNLKLASGFCPVARLNANGINVALGTDGAASNNDLDMFGEMRTAALLAKGVAGDASALPAFDALRMATINGAKALGLEEETGSIEKGKSADLVAVDLSSPHTQPVYNPVSQIVYAAGRENVTNVWVAGRRVVSNGELTTLDWDRIQSQSAQWQEKISRA